MKQKINPTRFFPKLFIYSGSLALVTYSLVIFFVGLGDAVMSYLVPVKLQDSLGNSLLMGIILGSSSLAGILADILIGEWFKNKKYVFFILWTIFMAFLFPMVFIFLPKIVPFFLLSMTIWGVYYELLQFANHHFVQTFVDKENHAQAWGVISAFHSSAYLLGPLIAERLVDVSDELPYLGALLLIFIGLLAFLFFFQKFKRNKTNEISEVEPKINLLHEMKIWKVLFKVVWPLLLFDLIITLVDASFWSIGAILSEELRAVHPLGGFLLTIYMIPSLFAGFFAGKLAQPFGKKRIAYLAAVASGGLLFFAGLTDSILAFLLLVFLSSTAGSLVFPEISAIFDDYIKRLDSAGGNVGNNLLGLGLSSTSVAYIFGPALAGAISLKVGFHQTFSAMGALLFFTAILCLIVTPRKIDMPQQEISELAI